MNRILSWTLTTLLMCAASFGFAQFQEVTFTGFTGSNIGTTNPGWSEATGATSPSGTTSSWGQSSSAQATVLNTEAAKYNLYSSNGTAWLVSPSMTIAATDSIKVDAAIFSYNSSTISSSMGSDDSVNVYITTNGWTSKTLLFSINASNSPTMTISQYKASLGSYSGQTAIIGIQGSEGSTNDPEDYDFHLTNIIIGTPPTIEMKANDAYALNNCYTATEPIYAIIENNSAVTINFITDTATVGVSISGQTTTNLSTEVTSGSLVGGDTMHVLVGTVNMTAVGTYDIDPYVIVSGDGNTSNDTGATVSLTTKQIYSTPQEVNFVGFTGSNLTTVFPGWTEANGKPVGTGTTSAWTASNATQQTSLGTTGARVNLYGTSRNEWIYSPKMSIVSTDSLKFRAAVTNWNSAAADAMGADDSLNVLVSIDCGASWSTIFSITTANEPGVSYVDYKFSLASYNGNDAIFAFYATSGTTTGQDYDFHITDIFAGTPPNIDMKANDAYSMNGCLSATEPVYAVIENNTPVTIDFSVANATVGAAITGQSTANLSTTLTTDSLQAGDTMHVMVGTTNMAAAGTYNVKPFVVVSGDGNTGNDTGSTVAMTNLPIASTPQKVNFAGFTGSNLPTVFPGWNQATGQDAPTGTTSFWTISNATQQTALGKTSARLNIYSTNRREWIVSPKMTATATDSLLFKAAVTNWNSAAGDAMGSDDSVNVMVSTDCGSTWNMIYSINANNDEPGNSFDDFALSLAAYSGNEIIIGFFATSGPTTGQDYDFHLTDIFIGTPPANDLGVTAILEPNGGCGSGSTDVKVAVYNYGNATQTSIGVSVDVTGSATTTLSGTVATLAPKTADTIVVGNFNTLAGGTYNFTGYTTHAGDQDNTNDTSMVTGIDIGAIPTNPNSLTGFTLCEGGDSMIVASGSTAAFRWYNSTSPDVVVSNSDTLSLMNMMATDTFEVEGYNFSNENVGRTSVPAGGFISASYGLGFNINSTIIIDTVTMYPNGTGWFIVNLSDMSNTVLQSADTVFVTGATYSQMKVPVNFTVNSGAYKLTLTYSGITQMGRESGSSFPYNSPSGAVSILGGVTSATGSATSTSYYWFYDWTITVPSCPSSRESVIVSVDPYPVVNIGSDTAFCGSSFVPFTLDATTPSASYAWSDASTNATLSITSSGTYWCDVTTTICTTRDSISVGANPIPTVTFPNPSFVCANADADSLTGGMPMGGVYSGTNVANGEFDPTAAGAGTDTLFYTYTDSIGCFATDTAYILVDTVAAPVMTSFTDICADNGNVLLNNATPVGGTYSGPGVTGVAFVPDSAGIGTHTIQYVYTGNNGCMDSTSEDITVNPLPMVSMTLQNNLCLNAMPIMLNTGMPMGGTYTIDGTVDTVYAPTVAGMDTVVYSYTDSNSCTSTDTSIIAADTVPVVTFATMADVCHMSATVTLMNGMPMGGTYTGNNVNTTAGTYSTANVGTDSVLYVFTDSNNCTESAIQTITVNALPTVALANFTDVCENAPSFALTGGTPAMGTYKGNGVNGANYDASTAGIGNDMITYVYTDVNNCTDSATNTIVVTAVTSASLRFLGEICDNGAAKDLVNTGIPSGGVFSGAGMTGSTFDPTVTGAGTQTISYTYTNAANCTDSTTNTILVEASPTFNIVSIDDLEGCNNSPIKLTTDLPGMTYRWSNGDVADTATYLQSGDASVKVTDPNTNSLCFNRDTITGLVFDEKCVGIDEALFGTSINYFPNPNNGTFNYSLEGFEGMDIDVTIVNAGGQVVYNNTWNNVSSMHNGTIQLESVETGLYFITLSTEKGNVMHRISITE